jgi:hypothetical protein
MIFHDLSIINGAGSIYAGGRQAPCTVFTQGAICCVVPPSAGVYFATNLSIWWHPRAGGRVRHRSPSDAIVYLSAGLMVAIIAREAIYGVVLLTFVIPLSICLQVSWWPSSRRKPSTASCSSHL